MGMNADVIAIGPFSKSIAGLLDYPAEFYDNTKPGTTVITTFCSAPGINTSNMLAAAMGVDPWDFNTHKIDSENIIRGLGALTEFAFATGESVIELNEHFNRLAKEGFTFFFRPNG